MINRLGFLAAGIVVGVVLSEYVIHQQLQDHDADADDAAKRDGLFAEVQGSTVRLYSVKDGHFCGYSETREFPSQDEAVEWVVKETNAKLVFTE